MNQQKINVEIDAGAEYMVNEDFNIDQELSLLNVDHILIEMSYLAENPNIHQHIFELQIKGIQPILAHPERYIYYFKDISTLKLFKEKGCLLQLNLLSVLGYYGKKVEQAAKLMLKENMYDLAGTDLHHVKHLAVLTDAVESGDLHQMIGSYPFKNKEIFES